MLYEKEEVYDLFQVTKMKPEYTHFLITGVFENYPQLTENEFILLSIRWKKIIKEGIHVDDIGCVINKGNIFVGIRNDRKEDFLSIVTNISVKKEGRVSLYTDVLELTKEETDCILG